MQAQIPLPRPDPSPEEPFPEPEPTQLPPPEELLPPLTPTPPEGLLPTPGTITVEQFRFEGNTAFDSGQLAQVTAPFVGRPISFADLLQARSAVTQLYVDNGYVTSGAFIPPQTIEDGVVTIQVIEGSLEEINVEVEGRLNPNYIRDRLALATETPLKVPRLVEALQLLQLNPLVERISAELSAGPRPGTNILDVDVELADPFTAQITLDNGRSPSVGSFRRGVELNEASLLGLGDNLRASYRNTDGSDDLDIAYTLPLSARNATLTLGYRTASSEVIESPFDILNIKSDFSRYEVTLRQPVIQTPSQELTLGLTAERLESQVTFEEPQTGAELGLEVQGADSEGRTQISTMRFFQEWIGRGRQQVFAARSQFSVGFDFGATVNEEPPDGRYFAWRGQAQWVRQLAADTLLLARSEVQLANRPLLPLEQFGVGGLGSVRGYRQDAILADNGLFASVELRLPIFRVPQQEMVLQVVPFFDVATAWNDSDSSTPELDPERLIAIGVGLNYQFGEFLSARLDWGIPLTETDLGEGTLQEDGIYFSITYTPF